MLCAKSNVVKPHGTDQRNHRRVIFRAFVEACHDAAVLLQSVKHTLNDIALSVLGAIKQPRQPRPGFTYHVAQRNHRLHPIRSQYRRNG